MADITEAIASGDFTPVLSGFGAGLADLIFWIVIGVAIAAAAAYTIWWLSFKHTVLIREVTSTRKFIVTDKAKIRRDRDDGVEYWHLRRRNVMLVSPKPESVDITQKGRFYAECYHDIESGRDGGYSWVVDDGKGTFISYPAEHRALLSARIRRAAERRGKGTFEMIMTIAAISIPLIALVVVFAFWGDLTKATNDAQAQLVVAMDDFADRVGDYACQQRISAAEPSINPSSNIPLADQIVRGVTS